MRTLENGVLSFVESIDQSDVEALASTDDKQVVTLWTMQQPGFVELLRREGRCSGSATHAFSSPMSSGKRAAYEWLQDQQRARVPGYAGGTPVWALLIRPLCTTRKDDRLLQLQVQCARALFFWYRPWTALLDFMSHPAGSLLLPTAHVDAFDHEKKARDFILRSRDEIRVQQTRMFDLHLASQPGFRWMDCPTVLQAVLEEVILADVVTDEEIRLV